MLTEVQFKGLYTGRISFVEYPEIIGFQLFGVVFLKFKSEMYAEQRVRLLALVQRAKQDGVSFSLVLVFPDDVEFSSIDMNIFKEIHVLMMGFACQFSMVCGLRGSQKLKGYGRTASLEIYPNLSEALLKTKPQYLMAFESKMTRNILVMDSDVLQREALVNALLADRFSAIGVTTFEESLEYINKLGSILDGAIFEFSYPEFRQTELVARLREVKPEARILIHTDVLDARLLSVCQKLKISCVLKSPFKPANLIRKYKGEFPERETNYLGFSE